ncbi:MAG: PadR family transcriptional regulator [Saprospiraceae bacterium]|nr:PadR family transcriptional regulator [Saprospiraceae bacterium]
MGREHLGEFEELVLLIVASRQGEAYGVMVMRDLADQANRKVNISAVHAALRRLEEKGYVKSDWSEASDKRGGRRKRVFTIRASGVRALEKSRDLRMQLWKNIPGFSPNFGWT